MNAIANNMQQTAEQQQKKSKQQTSRGMNLDTQQKQKELSSQNTANELKSLTQTKQQRKINDKEVDFLVKELGMDRNKATNILRKLDLKTAVKHIINN